MNRSAFWPTAMLGAIALTGCQSAREDNPQQLFEMRSKCAAFATQIEKDYRADPKNKSADTIAFTNHYDPNSHRCYVEQSGVFDAGGNNLVQIRNVIDGQEKRTLVGCIRIIGSKPQNPSCSDENDNNLDPTEAKRRLNRLMSEQRNWPE